MPYIPHFDSYISHIGGRNWSEFPEARPESWASRADAVGVCGNSEQREDLALQVGEVGVKGLHGLAVAQQAGGVGRGRTGAAPARW